MIKKCCVCRKVKEKGRWQKAKYSTDQQKVTHVYCPTCFKKTMSMINRLGGIGRINQPAQTDFAQII